MGGDAPGTQLAAGWWAGWWAGICSSMIPTGRDTEVVSKLMAIVTGVSKDEDGSSSKRTVLTPDSRRNSQSQGKHSTIATDPSSLLVAACW